MMTLQSWRPMFADDMKKQFMQSRFWESYRNEWTWELAIVDERVIKSIYAQMSECERQVLDKLLSGLLLQAKQESSLIAALSRQLGRPKQQCIAALETFAEAGIVCMLRHPWQGCYWLMALPIFHSWRAALHDAYSGNDVIRGNEFDNRNEVDSRNEIHGGSGVYCKQDSYNEKVVDTGSNIFDEPNGSSGHAGLAGQKYCLALPARLEQHCHFAQPVSLRLRLVLLLHQLSLQPLTFTKQGALRKTVLKQLQQEQEQLAACPALQQLWQQSFPSSVGGIESFMLELAYDLGLLDRNNNGLSLNEAKLSNWLKLSQQAQDKLIVQWLLQHMQEQHSSVIVLFINDLLSNGGSFWLETDFYTMSHKLMKQEGIGQEQVRQQWEALQQLLQFLSECGLVSYAAGAVAAATVAEGVRAVNRVAEHNLVQTGERDHSLLEDALSDANLASCYQAVRLYARCELAPPSYDMLHLEHNGELLALPGIRSELIWQALEIAELISPQEVLLFRITPQSLQSALERGHKAGEIKGWLHSLCGAELPQLVQQMVEGVLNVNHELKESVAQLSPGQPLLSLLTETAQMLGRNEKSTETAHYEPMVNEEQQADYGQPQHCDQVYYELRKLSTWGIYCANPLGMLLEAEMLAPDQIREHLHSGGTEALTRSWQRELRRYHSSTMLQIVEAALQFGFALYVTMNAKLWHIVPQFLEERNGNWYLTAAVYALPSLEPLTIELASIEAIQLDIDEGKGA